MLQEMSNSLYVFFPDRRTQEAVLNFVETQRHASYPLPHKARDLGMAVLNCEKIFYAHFIPIALRGFRTLVDVVVFNKITSNLV
jgi:hypothetical protein